ncbi:adenosylmethionine-8-amino-7-oxononanoate aminotransferase [Leucosporidium creatinivorum]|uniref:Adenosylmethionine-8-amino-7-oxononanoate aminotransferase n=1 Tax=Leucosporidium creatinivorum TaxID=106004 RepID=A0A1Y2F796_9BASI|nr:adenosylmethionine-8-amino-7-oxononanoate aminotransferase [Leucosporidium creatinivorum]
MATAQSTVFHRSLDHDPLFISKAEGNFLYTDDGRKILDGCGGAAVISIGHCDQRVVNAIATQLSTVGYLHSGAFANQPAEELANLLTDNGTTFARALFNSGGSEAAESAIKLARQYHVENGQPERVNFIARDMSYHGNTLGALGLARHVPRRKPYLPLMKSEVFHSVSPCYKYRYSSAEESDEEYVARLAAELEAKFQELGPGTVAAFFAETIVGATSGCTTAVPGYFKAIREVCDRHGALFCLDEIMCGIGRTGKLHAWEWEGVKPDIQTCGKGMAGGYAPISAILISHKVLDGMRKGTGAFVNGYTFQSHAVACRAAIEVLKIMKEDSLIEQCHSRGQLLGQLLHKRFNTHPNVGESRGRGLFWAIELVKDTATKAAFPSSFALTELISSHCLENGLVLYPGAGTIDGVQGHHMLIAPPYTITEEELAFLVDTLGEAVDACVATFEA